MLKSISGKTIEVLCFALKADTFQAVDMAREIRRDTRQPSEASCRAYLRKLVVAGLLTSVESRHEAPTFSISDEGRFVLWMVGHGFTREDGKWRKDKVLVDVVAMMDLREEFFGDDGIHIPRTV